MRRNCKITVAVYLVLGAAALLFVPLASSGAFGLSPDPRNGIFAVILSIPWFFLIDIVLKGQSQGSACSWPPPGSASTPGSSGSCAGNSAPATRIEPGGVSGSETRAGVVQDRVKRSTSTSSAGRKIRSPASAAARTSMISSP